MIRNVVEYLVESARRFPDKVALIDEWNAYSFEQIDYKAKQVASAIASLLGDNINQPIAIYMKKSIDCIVAFMGILYSGNFYTPLDIHTPSERIDKIVDVLCPRLVIYDDELPDNLKIIDNRISLQEVYKNVNIVDEAARRYKKVLDIDPVYTLFTSGSTGQPKGVVISHKGVIDYTEWLKDTFDFDETTIFGNQAPFYFDNSILDIYSTFKNASTMVILPEKSFTFQRLLIQFMNEHKVNTIFWVPSALIGLVNSGVLEELNIEYLNKILFCGEVMPNKQLNVWRRKYPQAVFANLYGPTEITDVCTYYIVDRNFEDDESLPIGKACENTEILILNKDNQIVSEGEIGELCVRGTGLSMGYYRDSEKTDKAFVQNPLNDKYIEYIYRTGDLVMLNELQEIIYIGRKDFQIKHQGHRIELGEIETIANSIVGVGMCGAIYDRDEQKIVIYVTVESDLNEKSIYQQLKKRLPSYMLPAKIIIIEKMPLNLNGKIDRPILLQIWKGTI